MLDPRPSNSRYYSMQWFSEVAFWKKSFRMSHRFSWSFPRATNCVSHWVPTNRDLRNTWMSTLAEFSHELYLENVQNSVQLNDCFRPYVPYLRLKGVGTHANCSDLKAEIEEEACTGHDVYQTNIFETSMQPKNMWAEILMLPSYFGGWSWYALPRSGAVALWRPKHVPFLPSWRSRMLREPGAPRKIVVLPTYWILGCHLAWVKCLRTLLWGTLDIYIYIIINIYF